MLLGLGLFAPSSVRAGCGSHVFSSTVRSGIESLTVLDMLETSETGQVDPLSGNSRRDVPCSGPTCSKGPGIPYAPSPLPSVRSETWCCTSINPPLNAPDLSGHLAETVSRRPVHCPLSIERPPRFPS